MPVLVNQSNLAFQRGELAYEVGKTESDNPYGMDEAELRASWFNGWTYARMCGGNCSG